MDCLGIVRSFPAFQSVGKLSGIINPSKGGWLEHPGSTERVQRGSHPELKGRADCSPELKGRADWSEKLL